MGGITMKNIYAQFVFDPAWRCSSMPNPNTWSSVTYIQDKRNAVLEEERFKSELEAQGLPIHRICCELNQEFAYPSLPPSSEWPGSYGARDMIATAAGAPEPRWENGNWWHERDHYPLSADIKKSDIERLKVTDWKQIPAVSNMIASCRDWAAGHPAENPSLISTIGFPCFIPAYGWRMFINYPSFVDIGIYLMGMTEFLTMVAIDPDTADCLMDKCFEFSTSYTDFLLKEQPETFGLLGGFGGDTTCMLSPALYPRFGLAWDLRLWKHVRQKHGIPDDLPCNLHSCGVSNHLYDSWANHPCWERIAIMQTRLIPGAVGKLRESLPRTHLELTIHPPQFDLVRASHDEIKEILISSINEAAGEVTLKLHFVITSEAAIKQAMQAMEACAETLKTTFKGREQTTSPKERGIAYSPT
jgi:hypothetical protein